MVIISFWKWLISFPLIRLHDFMYLNSSIIFVSGQRRLDPCAIAEGPLETQASIFKSKQRQTPVQQPQSWRGRWRQWLPFNMRWWWWPGHKLGKRLWKTSERPGRIENVHGKASFHIYSTHVLFIECNMNEKKKATFTIKTFWEL